MTDAPLPALPDTPFWRAYQGRFAGFPTWVMLDAFWPVLASAAAEGDWFVLDLDAATLPSGPAAPGEVASLLDRIQALYAPARSRGFCGVVFADDPVAPAFVKFFDPWKMGASCGSSGERIMPLFTLSRMAPDALPEPPQAHAESRPGLFARLLGPASGRGARIRLGARIRR